jgi:hypothetical protein
MTGFIVSVFSFQNRVSPKEAFEGLEPGEGKLSRPVLRGLGSREAARPLDSNANRPDSRHSFGFVDSPGLNRFGQHYRVYRGSARSRAK